MENNQADATLQTANTAKEAWDALALLRQALVSLGIQKGDTLDVASDLLSVSVLFLRRGQRPDPDAILDLLCEMVGEEGTVLIRAFNWDFCHGTAFDVLKSPSRVGGLGNAAAKRTDFVRTHHPLYSWWVWGKDAKALAAMEYADSFGDESVFAYLEAKNAYQLTIGNTHPELTFIHRAEQLFGWKFRFFKYFTGTYIDETGKESTRTYSMYVRDLGYRQVRAEFEVLEPRLIEHGLMQMLEMEGVRVKKIALAPATQLVVADMASGKVKDYYWYVPIEEKTE